MANISRNFVAGRMNKAVDERLIPNGEYIDALNCRLGSSEESEIGAIENAKGNLPLTTLIYPPTGTPLSSLARCIGALQDGANETIYWFVHDPNFSQGATGKLDLIVSFNTATNVLTYHIVSIDDNNGINTTLNFNPSYLITGVNLVDSNQEGLLFWTDDYNQPRFINIRRTYTPPIAFIDQFTNESILVVKKPPYDSPSIQPLTTGGEQNFLEERFICFAYRYKYTDGEYSATSQFSEPSFLPNPFQFSVNSFLNEGMVNLANTTVITYNTGGPLVRGIDLLFKEASSNQIKVIEKLDKDELGLPDNTNLQYTFTNSKIFTVLPEAELLRLYDNVPLLSKAQTIMGNRLVYGNYVEGYDLIDLFGNPLRLTYISGLVSKEINNDPLTDTTSSGNYSIDGAQTIPNSVLEIDFTTVAGELNAGAQLNIALRVTHDSFTGSTPFPTETTQSVQVDWSFTLPVSYTSVYDMATSTEFIEAIGTIGNIKPVYSPIPPTSCDGFTLTDILNCALPNNLNGSTPVTKYASGISGPAQPISIVSTPASNIIKLQVPAMNYVGDVNNPTLYSVYEYYEISYAEAFWSGLATPKSLHSNRGYEIGIVYMDEYLRASTALVSNNNTVFVPCSYCDRQNQIRVLIPTTQRAPYWAKRYKFVIKADRENYETVYATLFFRDPNTNNVYILLEGENSRKVETGDRLIVKADTAGPAQNCQYTTVLEKESKARGFLTIPSILDPTVNLEVPAGVYMKINPSNLTLVQDELSYITDSNGITASGTGSYPIAGVLVNRYDTATSAYVDYDIPAGSRIRLNFKFERRGSGDGNNACERRIYTLDKTLVASADYNNFKDWFDGDNVEVVLTQGIQDVGAGGCAIGNTYDSSLSIVFPGIVGDYCNNRYRFYRDPSNNSLSLVASGTRACGTSSKKKSSVSLTIEVFRAENVLIFETEPQDTLPDVFFENNLSFEVGPNGEHYGNVTNQNFSLGVPGVVDTEFFNCFAFGNGAESYRIRDSIVGKTFNLGNRVVSVSAQDYQEADRFADLTYSGIYNDESNVNRLNEFNLGLLNYKPLEDSFGPITLLDARETDILVLQEDKVSYVLAGKNLLSDAAAGGAITSVPEVLGTQIARIENFGNSFNPESYAKWGEDKFFTDAKRGAVLQLKGDSFNNERMFVVSEAGMRPWFRDMFIDSLGTQKLGGYDPYMTEYVLTNNDIPIPTPEVCIGCSTPQVVTVTSPNTLNYCVDVGILVGPFDVTWNTIYLTPSAAYIVQATYDGVTYASGVVISGSGSLTIPKNSITPSIVYVQIIPIDGSVNIQVDITCPEPSLVEIIEIVINNDADGGKYIHAEYGYTDTPYVSPITSNLITLASGTSNPLVAWYNAISGYQGSGSIPVNGGVVSMYSNKINFDDFDFNPAFNKFRWLRTNTTYPNTTVGISSLLAAANTATPILGSAPTYYANFTMPNTSDDKLYLIWDFRTPVESTLCYSDVDVFDACCGCEECNELCSFYDVFSTTGGVIQYTDCNTSEIISMDVPLSVIVQVCSSTIPNVLSGDVDVTFNQCGCPS